MNVERLRELMNARPFRTFTIHTNDGQQFPVQHPDFIATRPDSFTVTVYGEAGQIHIVNVVQINSVEVAAEPARRG